ncbi:hypothetical protein ACFY04_04940, partial [Streptomyces sp. NPDC001549]|uniref:hypothetical protein n=1 Tax=Streptomyces sp. NPDC001549 TaxID=3364586 RepID=UPI00368BFE54
MARELLFFNSRSGRIQTARLDTNGHFDGLDEGQLNSGWTAVTAVGRELLFYNSDNGIIATGRLD